MHTESASIGSKQETTHLLRRIESVTSSHDPAEFFPFWQKHDEELPGSKKDSPNPEDWILILEKHFY